MRRNFPILFSALALACSSLACAALSREMSLENLRMAYDSDGTQVTAMFSPSDIFYAVADLSNAPQGTVVKAVWAAVDVVDTESGLEFQEQTLEISEEEFSGTIYFELSNDDIWPAGLYRVNLYLNDTRVQSMEFDVE